MRISRYLILILFCCFWGILSCTNKKRSDFIKQACVQGNPNCVAPTVQIGTSGSESDQLGVNVGNGQNINNAIKIKSIRYGDTTTLEFILNNSTLNPLHDMRVEVNPGDVAFEVIAGVSEPTCTEGYFYYAQKCAVGIQFTLNEESSANGVLPANQTVRFIFKTLTGGEFVFEAVIKPSDLIPDLYIASADLNFPNLLIYDTGQACSYTQDLTVFNYGTEKDITDMHYSLQGDSSFSIQATVGYCSDGGTIAKNGGTCKLKICFKPTQIGKRIATLVLTGSNATIRQYNLNGNGLAPLANLENFDFGSMVAGTASSAIRALMLTIPRDSQSTSAANCSYSLTGSSQFSVMSNGCSATPAASASCSVSLQYSAASTDQIDKGQFKLNCTQRGGKLVFNLSGVSSTRPMVADTVHVDFGEVLVGETTSATISFQNVGTGGALTGFATPLSVISGTGVSASSSSCSSSLAQGASCSVVLNYTATEPGAVVSQFGGSSNEGDLGRNIGVVANALAITPSQTSVEFGVLEIGKDRPGPIISFVNPAKTKTMSGCVVDASSLTAQGFTLETNSTCLTQGTLAAGLSCTLIPRFKSASPEGLHSVQVNMSCSVGGSTSITLTGYVSNELRLVAVPPTNAQFDKRLVGITQEIEFLFENQHATESANSLAIISSVPSSWSFISAVNSAADCRSTSSLAPGDNCGLRLRYSPSAIAGSEAVGVSSGTVMGSAASGTIHSVDPLYSATAVKLSPSISSFDFGVVSTADPDSISADTMVIKNPSNVDTATGCALSLTNSTDFAIYNETCNDSLLPGAICGFQIKAKSNARTTSVDASAYVYYTCTVGGRASVSLYAQIKKPPQMVWTPSNLSYGTYDIVYTTAGTLDLTHTGTLLDSSVQNLVLTTSGTVFSISGHNCSSVMVPGANCDVNVNFYSTTEGTFTSNLVANSSPDNLTVIAALTAVAVAPRVKPDVLAINFGTVGTLSSRSSSAITLTNTSYLADDSGCNITTPTFFSLINNNCGSNFSLTKRAACDFIIQLDPQPTVGVYTGTAAIDCADPGPVVYIPLTSEVLNNANITMGSTPSADFGYQDYVLSGEERTYTFTNLQGVNVTLSTFGLNASSSSSFSISSGGSCANGMSFTNSSSCTVKIKFNPSSDTTTAAESATLVFGTEAFNPGSHSDFVFTGRGSAMSLVLSTPTLAFADREVGQASYEALSANLTNNGTRTASLSYSSISSPPFTNVGNCTNSLGSGATCTLSYQFVAAVIAATHDANLLITETQNTSAATLTLLAETFSVPTLTIKDNLDNTSYASNITATYITGATIGHARNIIDFVATPTPNPVADVTYTINYTPGGAGNSSPISIGTLYGYLSHFSGTANTMSVLSDACSNSTLNSSTLTCTFKVRYTPTSNNETSVYKMLNIPFTSALTGLTTATISVNSIQGRSTRSVNLTISQSTLDFGPITTATNSVKSVVVTNSGDQTATNLLYVAAGSAGAGIFATPVPTGVPSPPYCGDTLNGGESCTLDLKYSSSVAGAFQDLFNISGLQSGANRSILLRGASYNQSLINETVDLDGFEADIATTGSLYFIVSRRYNTILDNAMFDPIINICDKSVTTGELITSSCRQSELALTIGVTSGSGLAGSGVGSGPRILTSGSKFAVLLKNMDPNYGGIVSLGGNLTLVVCNIPTGTKLLVNGDCQRYNVHTDLGLSGYGAFGSFSIKSGKIVMSSQSPSGTGTSFALVACDFDNTVNLATTSPLSACQKTTPGTNPNQSNHTEIFFDGNYAYVTAYNSTSSAEALVALSCLLNGDNSFSCGAITTLDSDRRGVDDAPPGSYPSAYYDNGRLFVAYQSGSASYTKLRLSVATVTSGTIINPAASYIFQSSIAGTGASPRMVVSGNSTNGRLWISSCLLSSPSANNNPCLLEIYKCDLLNGVPNCNSTPYFQQSNYYGKGVIYSRSLLIDLFYKILISPFDYFYSGSTDKNAILNLGLIPELN
jgi:hypothetical protein